MRTSTRFASLIAGFVILSTLSGCGSEAKDKAPLGRVTGTATIRGKAYPNLQVTFQPEKGKAGTGMTDAQGNFKLFYGSQDVPGAPIGKCKVVFMWADPSLAPEGVTIPSTWGPESETTVDVKSGSNEFKFELTD